MFESPENSGILQSFAVDPMASDLETWKGEDFLLFSLLIRLTMRRTDT